MSWSALHGETDLPVLQGWRAELFGKEAEALIAGKVALCIEQGQLRIIKQDRTNCG